MENQDDGQSVYDSQLRHDISLEAAKIVFARQYGNNPELTADKIALILLDIYWKAQSGFSEFIEQHYQEESARKQAETNEANAAIHAFVSSLKSPTKTE